MEGARSILEQLRHTELSWKSLIHACQLPRAVG